jgi:hypothetical protein
MARGRRVTKRCKVCGRKAAYKPRETKCKHIERAGVGTGRLSRRVYCWGQLEKVTTPKREVTTDAKLAHAREKLAAQLTKMKRAITLADKWKRRVAKLEDQRASERAAAAARGVVKVTGSTRHIELE